MYEGMSRIQFEFLDPLVRLVFVLWGAPWGVPLGAPWGVTWGVKRLSPTGGKKLHPKLSRLLEMHTIHDSSVPIKVDAPITCIYIYMLGRESMLYRVYSL